MYCNLWDGVLRGEDARRFEERINNVKKVSEEERKRLFDNYDKVRDRTVQDVYDFCKDKISLLKDRHNYRECSTQDDLVAEAKILLCEEINDYIKARSSDLKI